MAAQDDLGILGQFFEWAGDVFSPEEKESFIKEVMSRRGHKPVMNWTDDDSKGGKSGGNSNVLGIRSGGQKASGGSNWNYG